jgi:DNA-binding NarL/FixJ family response regulator
MPIKGDGRILEMSQISVLIIDEDNLSRKGLRKMLNDLNWFTEIAEIGTYEHTEETYDIVIVCNDFKSAGLIKEIRANDAHQKIIVLLLHLEELVIAKLIEEEVNGIVLKTSPFEELIKCIQLVAEGRDFFSQEVSTMFYHLWTNKKSLKELTAVNFSKRETEVLVAICNQKTNDEIAEELFLSPSSVKKYRCSLLEKTKSKTSAGLILYAVKNGIYKV